MDHNLSVACTLAVTAWALSVLAMLAGLVTSDLRYMGVGLWFTGAGAALTVRQVVCKATQRQQDVFQMGREHERNNVRRMH